MWEAAQFASFHRLDNLCAIVDVNRLGQSGPTMYEHHVDVYEQRLSAFGWQTAVVDGHDVRQIRAAFARARAVDGKPFAHRRAHLQGPAASRSSRTRTTGTASR